MWISLKQAELIELYIALVFLKLLVWRQEADRQMHLSISTGVLKNSMQKGLCYRHRRHGIFDSINSLNIVSPRFVKFIFLTNWEKLFLRSVYLCWPHVVAQFHCWLWHLASKWFFKTHFPKQGETFCAECRMMTVSLKNHMYLISRKKKILQGRV